MAHEYGETYGPLYRDPDTGALGDDPNMLMGHNGGPEMESEDYSIDDEDLAAWIHTRITDARVEDGDEVSETRKENLDYYLGRPYGDEKTGYSKVVTRDVFELVEWGLASLVRIFLSAPRIVEFKPMSGEDIAQAHQETEVVHSHLNGAFTQLLFWVRDALLFPNAYLKVWHEDEPKREKRSYQGLTEPQVGMLMQDPEVELLGAQPRQAWPGGPAVYDVEIQRTTYSGKLCIEAVPPEEILVLTETPASLSLDDLDYAHHRRVTRSELIEMGYDRDWVMDLPTASDYADNDERASRQPNQSEDFNTDQLDVMELVDYYECYITIDQDGDGYAERRRICCVASSSTVEIIENEEDDFSGMCTLSTVPQSHRHVGVSLADSGKWVQRVSSALTRQMLDNLYRTNRPRTFAGPGTDLEQLENYVPHGVVEVNDPNMVREEQVSTVIDKVLPVLQHFDQEKEAGSGVSRHTMGLDAERLQDTTMGAYVNALGQASQRLELIARTFAETGFAELAKKVHYCIRTNQDIARVYRIQGEWTEVDPATWRDQRDVEPCVGLGYGTSQERVASGMALLDVQKEAIPHGLSTKDRVYRNLEDVVRAMGKRDPSMYFLDPSSEEGQQVAQGLAEEQQAQQSKMDRMMDMAQATEEKKTTTELMKMRQNLREHIDKELREWAKMELEHEVDIAGKGIDPSTMKPMPGSNSDA